MRQLLVFGEKTFKVTVPDDAKVTFGPWSPPGKDASRFDTSREALKGTLRVYKTEKDIMAVFSGVSGFRDLSLGYSEQVVVEEGAVIWKDDEASYVRDEKLKRETKWVAPEVPLLPATSKTAKGKKA